MWGSIFNRRWWSSVIYRLAYRSRRLDWCSWHTGGHHHSWHHWWHHGWHLWKEFHEKFMWTANFPPALHRGRARCELRGVKHILCSVWSSHSQPKTSTNMPFIQSLSLTHTHGASGPTRQHYSNHINDFTCLYSCSSLYISLIYMLG